MLTLARLVLRLATLYLLLGVCLFLIMTQGFGIAPVEVAQEVIIVSVVFYCYTLIELGVTSKLSHKDSSIFIGVNLGFSLLRLFLTLIVLFITSNTSRSTLLPPSLWFLLYYFATLIFSTWHRRNLNQSTNNSNEKNNPT